VPTIKDQTTVSAGTQENNVIQGNQFEFLQTPSRVQVWAAQATTGTPGVAEIEVFLSQELQLPQCPINGRDPVTINTNTDLIVDTVGDRGDRIVVREVETGGSNDVVVQVMVVITPL
jgi:hypothetical protein